MPEKLEEYPLGKFLSRTYLSFRKRATRLIAEYDVTPEQYAILNELSKADSISQKKLAEILVRDQTTVGKIVDKLMRKELVTRTVDPEDRRAVQLYLTDKGRQLHDELFPLMIGYQKEITAGITQEELAVFYKVFNRIYEQVK
ncbi:MarR family winged helix-turn-helix transcriptional regulator [Paenibacillus terreus]|uniref:MarR family winged helix-turn-helix transcriptional regulator n=1 Tax=Paenibacillus terreus TaxID=1387834 RepID=A0ABV5B5C3_9BACL